MRRILFLLCFLCGSLAFTRVSAQVTPATPAPETQGEPENQIDSLRRLEEEGKDSVVFTAKYIRFTTRRMLHDSTYTAPIDTSLRGLQNYNAQYNPYSPTLNLGNFGLSSRDMLFSQRKNLDFDAGFHALDRFLLNQDSVKYYRARTPFTQFWYITGGRPEQFFQLTHTQNIKPNWNIGAVYRRIGSEGFYLAQKSDHNSVMAFTWYQSPNGRYGLTANGVFNALKAGENGSVSDDNYFLSERNNIAGSSLGPTRLHGQGPNRPAQTLKSRDFSLKHTYNIGRIDTLGSDSSRALLPTQRLSHEVTLSRAGYRFFRNEPDTGRAFPQGIIDDAVLLTRDSTSLSRLSNEFRYSFYLRGRTIGFLKNEIKLDLGIRHDLYRYAQTSSGVLLQDTNFSSVTFLADAGYRFSDRVLLEAGIEQVLKGMNAGNFRYEANTSVRLSRSAGTIVLGAYVLNRAPERMFERVDYQFHQWDLALKNTKTTNFSFEYENPLLRLKARAEYFLLSNYLYYNGTILRRQVIPAQLSSNINLLKVSVGNTLTRGKLTLENFLVYQKTDFQDILRTPEAYLYTSFYRSQQLFKSIDTQLGLDSRYNTPFAMPWYATDISQFYNGLAADYETYPVVDVWLKASLRRATLLVKYAYANQGLPAKGYYTVNRYPMPNRMFVFGVKWNFYN